MAAYLFLVREGRDYTETKMALLIVLTIVTSQISRVTRCVNCEVGKLTVCHLHRASYGNGRSNVTMTFLITL